MTISITDQDRAAAASLAADSLPPVIDPNARVEVFLDTETGGLRPDDRVWEFSAVRRTPDGTKTYWTIQVADFEPSKADPKALEMSGFWTRHQRHVITDPTNVLAQDPMDHMIHPAFAPHVLRDGTEVRTMIMPEISLAYVVERLCRDAIVWACNPVYDVPRLTSLLDRASRPWTGHYRPECATSWAAATGAALGLDVGPLPPVPLDNKLVGAGFGIDREEFGPAHASLPDCLYAEALVDAARDLVKTARGT